MCIADNGVLVFRFQEVHRGNLDTSILTQGAMHSRSNDYRQPILDIATTHITSFLLASLVGQEEPWVLLEL